MQTPFCEAVLGLLRQRAAIAASLPDRRRSSPASVLGPAPHHATSGMSDEEVSSGQRHYRRPVNPG